MGEYTLIALVSIAAVVVLEFAWWKTGIFRQPAFWIALAICYAFMIAVDGWLTKLSAPIVIYSPDGFSGLRVPWDIPFEDYLFGFSMLTLAMMAWDRSGARAEAR